MYPSPVASFISRTEITKDTFQQLSAMGEEARQQRAHQADRQVTLKTSCSSSALSERFTRIGLMAPRKRGCAPLFQRGIAMFWPSTALQRRLSPPLRRSAELREY